MSQAARSPLDVQTWQWPDVLPVLPRRAAVPALLDRVSLEQQALDLGARWAGLAGSGRIRRWQGLVLVVDGGSGAGKTHLCQELLAGLHPLGLPLRHRLALDDLVPGWQRLEDGVRAGATVLRDLDAGRAGRAGSWCWERMRPGPQVEVAPLSGGVLLLEGCGALACAAQSLPHLRVLRVWVDLDRRSRAERVRQRDSYEWDTQSWEAQQVRVEQVWAQAGRQWWPSLVVRGHAPGSVLS